MSQEKEQGKSTTTCRLCGAKLTGIEAIGHMLVAHGPLAVSPSRKKRRTKTVAMLPQLFRRLENMGFAEEQAHRILQAVTEELRKLGMV